MSPEVVNDHGTDTRFGHTIQVRRVDAESAGYTSSFEYEFELLVDDEVVMTAGQLEQRGNPWAQVSWPVALRAYGKSYVDGLEER